MVKKLIVKKVAVLGAGVMGAQIAAHLANAKVQVILFDLACKEGSKNAIVEKALKGLSKLKPAPFASDDAIAYIQAANYEDDLDLLKESDLVIEAVAEKFSIKESVYQTVIPYLSKEAIFATNTSGLSIEELASKFSQNLKHRFCGVHFFNPPRYMHLVELIPCTETEESCLQDLEYFLVSVLGKGVVRAKDTPNFIANRLGVFSMLATIANAEKYQIDFATVDDLTGKRLGRPKSATFRTADVVGLDTFAHVAKTMEDALPNDPWHRYFTLPEWLTALINEGKLGAKTGGGIYQRVKGKTFVWDPDSKQYVESVSKADREVIEILKNKNALEKFKALRGSDHPQAKFLWHCFADLFHYTAYHAQSIANTARDIDFAIRWGFGWEEGPLESWQRAGIEQIKTWLLEEIQANRLLSGAPLPIWLEGLKAFHNQQGSFNFNTKQYQARSELNVYHRQIVPATLFGESRGDLGKIVWKNDAVRAFTLDDKVLVVENITKNHAIGQEVLEAINHALDMAEDGFAAMVLWNEQVPFSVGADLKSMAPAFASGDFASIDRMIHLFQKTSMRLRYSYIPVVAAVQGYAFGGGCEMLLHCDRVVAALESYIGLVEVGVGVLPAGGGTKEFALRAAQESKGDLLAAMKNYYMNIASAKVATSALEAKKLGFLRESDVVVFNAYEILYVALSEALALAQTNYRPAQQQTFIAGGPTVAASIQGQLVNMKEGRFISDYDYYLGNKIAWVMTGGDVATGSLIDEWWILDLERRTFVELLKNTKTQERIQGMLATGKPVRN